MRRFDSNKYNLMLIASGRPNFIKIVPLMNSFEKHATIRPVLVHTGQHYYGNMSDPFFSELDIPEPDINLEVGAAPHAAQTALIMERFEKVCLDMRPDMVMVVGDVKSTAACTLVASELSIPTAHYEAGLRSHDRSMPEEMNRLFTDGICDYFFTTSSDANDNLMREGKAAEHIFLVGNLMIDALIRLLPEVDTITNSSLILPKGKGKNGYALVTLHHPSNVDNIEMLMSIMKHLKQIAVKLPVVFPVHPRTLQQLRDVNCNILNWNVSLIEPVGYLLFLSLQKNATVVITDSGSIQEETTVLGVPCLTIQNNTERPITIWEGTNKLIDVNNIEKEVDNIIKGNGKKGKVPDLWDGKASERIRGILERLIVES